MTERELRIVTHVADGDVTVTVHDSPDDERWREVAPPLHGSGPGTHTFDLGAIGAFVRVRCDTTGSANMVVSFGCPR